jgi:glycosyltransferase involved in cell wall biosynthesis
MNPKISICIPTYEMHGLGVKYLAESFEILKNQTFKNFDVTVSDHSKNNDIKILCEKYQKDLRINYFKNEEKRGNSSANLNNAIKNADGEIIKILFQDDFLFHENSLLEISSNFDTTRDSWLITGCEHFDNEKYYREFYPKYNKYIHLGINTISSPSVLSIKNENPILFDENLIWLMDVDYYKKCYRKFGPPKILNTINVVNRTGNHQVSNSTINAIIKLKETLYTLFKKY